MAVWELVAAAHLYPAHTVSQWKPELGYSTSRGAGGIRVPGVSCFFLPEFFRPPPVKGIPADPDIFLEGIDCKSLHAGIREGIEQALACFRRGLYMPAMAMLAAAAEATWIECGLAVATKLGLKKLENTLQDSFLSIRKKVDEIRKALEQPNGKQLVKDAGRTAPDLDNAEQWTTILRDRRNALHWGKAKSFVADHTETGTLMMGAPLHMGTLEAIRAAC
jgi:hypothetical protein